MFVWTHRDKRGFFKAAEQALARCDVMGWGVDAIAQSDGTRLDDFLTLLADSLLTRQELIDAQNKSLMSELEPIGNKIAFNVGQGTAPDVDHVNAQVILLRTWEVLARNEGWKDESAAMLSADTGKSDAQANVVEIVAIVVGIIALAAVIAFVVWNANVVIDRELARRQMAQELMRQHADCQRMLQNHADAERKAGHAIPFTTPELAVMARLGAMQDQAMGAWKDSVSTPIARPPTPVEVVGDVATLAVVLGFLYFLIRKEI